MNYIIPIQDRTIGVQTLVTTTAKCIHEYLGVKTKFSMWIQRAIEKYDFLENIDFSILKSGNEVIPKNGNNLGGRPGIDYIVTLDMAKELCMLENNPKGKETRKYFIDAEKNLSKIGEAYNQNKALTCYPIEVEPNKIINIYKNQSGGFIVGDGSVNSLLKVEVLKFLELKLGTKALKVLLRSMIPILNTPEALEDQAQDQDDTLSGFIECYVVIDQNARTKSRDVYEAYLKWCATTGDSAMNHTDFIISIKRYGIGKHKQIRFDDGVSKGFVGFTIAPFGGAL